MVIEYTQSKLEELLQTSKPVVVDFYASWCGPCQKMSPELDALSIEMEQSVAFVKVNIENHPAVAAQYGITALPTLVVLKNTQELGRMVGFMSKEAIKAKIQSFNQ